MIIKLENIYKTYKNEIEYPALKNISFSVEKGEFVAIVGPSGSGKSTLMHILGCLDKPTSGKYFFEGKDVSSLSDDELAEIRKKKIGFVFQQFNLLPHRSVLQNVMLPLVYAGVSSFERERIAKEVLRNSAFPEDFWYHLPNQLSGGMMQRVAIARALVNDPVLILADEPTGNLDSKTGEKVLETFEGLNKQGRTIILVTHERYIAKRAKRIISLKDGKIISDTKESDHQEILKEIKE
jgi:putative ABC transport system ATP-binding protein